ncbi:hypothetical protein ATEG_05254 [Aspergillus terreus NIH2624]|uniref:Uncharacterized protein n=1 Tax=Aspergillus terreus (strain NIH 2624 / FGSC A1156) TaxID=341663 RepID=Q0CM30_ASPTN|nr:uncharacterized protein ATEG_05254 [Aspergillus terreus NIH2624]EAU34323.1 hypothetical protein ATEG_05254 [Aspergillus terreus NIH2624]
MKATAAALGLLASTCFMQLASCNLVKYELNLSWEDREVAGAVRKTILVNGQFPGPTLRMKQGDDVEVLVNNSMPFGTTVHWHGIEQLGTPWSDGVPGLSQENIPPGEEFLYQWKAVDYGAYIYHSHARGQIDDGLYGAIIVEPDDCVEQPFDLITQDPSELEALRRAERETQPIIVSDWRHMTSEELWQAEEVSGMENYCVNAVLINGKGSTMCLAQDRINALTTDTQREAMGNQTLTDMACLPPIDAILGPFDRTPELAPPGFYKDCTAGDGPTERFEVDPATMYRSWDLISMASVSTLVFSIDEHPMYVYRVDGRYIEPLRVDAVTVPIGTRYSVFTKLDQPAGDYTVRVANTGVNQIINGTAVMTYTPSTQGQRQRRPSQASITETGINATTATVILNETSVVPFPVVRPAATVDQTVILNVDRWNSSYQWLMGEDSYSMELEEASPVLFNKSSIPSKYTISTRNGTWVDLIFNISSTTHPIHKHSNKFFVLGSGTGAWNWSSVSRRCRTSRRASTWRTPSSGTRTTRPVRRVRRRGWRSGTRWSIRGRFCCTVTSRLT